VANANGLGPITQDSGCKYQKTEQGAAADLARWGFVNGPFHKTIPSFLPCPTRRQSLIVLHQMSAIEIESLHSQIRAQLKGFSLSQIDMKVIGESGLQIQVDGKKCLTSIGIWPNGDCDVDFFYVESERGDFRHFEFNNNEEALGSIIHEINLALERAN